MCHLAQRKLGVREVCCVGTGAARRQLVVLAEDRTPLVDAAIAAGARDAAAALELVQEARRRGF